MLVVNATGMLLFFILLWLFFSKIYFILFGEFIKILAVNLIFIIKCCQGLEGKMEENLGDVKLAK